VPVADVVLDLLTPRGVRPGLQALAERRQGGRGVAGQADLDRVAVGQHRRIRVDLHRAGLARGRVELGPRAVAADDQQGVAVLHHPGGSCRAQVAHRAGRQRVRLVQVRLAQQAGGHCGAEVLRQRHQLILGAPGTLPGQDGEPFAGLDQLHCGGQVVLAGQQCAVRPQRSGADLAVLLAEVGRGLLLHVVRQDQHRRLPAGQRRPEGPVEHHRQLLGRGDLFDERRDVLEQRRQVDLLLVARPQHAGVLLGDQRHYRRAVQLGVVEAVEDVDCARPLGDGQHPYPAGVLGLAGGHEGGALLVLGLDELRGVAGPPQRTEQRVVAVPGVAVDALHAPVGQAAHDQVDGLLGRHVGSSGSWFGRWLASTRAHRTPNRSWGAGGMMGGWSAGGHGLWRGRWWLPGCW